ncbi:MAG: bifunctional adenosylcobinamide kinase/adenosylcobinamide-phosphate guanylyltransferase [Atopobiaceae bacterium]|nr:bifunctional adenosylcobinamide kinase/adenosylcobinamide-phosphate guanylyltransferase [Atopobiaceae bacterium]
MFSLIVGGAASGKSAFAEQLALARAGRRTYIATMEPYDEECVARIAKHRARRADYGFATLECPRNLGQARVDKSANILLDCVGNLVANELYTAPEEGGPASDATTQVTATSIGPASDAPFPDAPPRATTSPGKPIACPHSLYEARWPHVARRIAADVLRLRDACANLTVVTNEVCLGGTEYEGDTIPYMRCLAFVNRLLATEADLVCEIVAGMPNVLKGDLEGLYPCA